MENHEYFEQLQKTIKSQMSAYNSTMGDMIFNQSSMVRIMIQAINTINATTNRDAVALSLLVKTVREMQSDYEAFWKMQQKKLANNDEKLVDLLGHYEKIVLENGLKINESQLN